MYSLLQLDEGENQAITMRKGDPKVGIWMGESAGGGWGARAAVVLVEAGGRELLLRALVCVCGWVGVGVNVCLRVCARACVRACVPYLCLCACVFCVCAYVSCKPYTKQVCAHRHKFQVLKTRLCTYVHTQTHICFVRVRICCVSFATYFTRTSQVRVKYFTRTCVSFASST
jgi:hypothetical protein